LYVAHASAEKRVVGAYLTDVRVLDTVELILTERFNRQ
jgi:hypothetical protein